MPRVARSAAGEIPPTFGAAMRHRPHRLTENQVASIKARLRMGDTVKGMAREFGVAKSTIGWIKNGRNWAHVAPESEAEKRLAYGDR